MASTKNYPELVMKNDSDLVMKHCQVALDTAKQVVEINLQTGEKLLEKQVELTGNLLSAASRDVDLMVKAKGYSEVFGGQARLALDCAQQLLAGYRDAAEILVEASKSLAAVVNRAATSARDNIAKAA